MFGFSLAIFSSPLGEKGKKCASEDGGGEEGNLPGRLDAEDLPELSNSSWHFLLGLSVLQSSSLLLQPGKAGGWGVGLISQKSL